MRSSDPCDFSDRDRLALDDAASRLEGEDLHRWEEHLVACASCAERAALDAPVDVALAVWSRTEAVRRARRRRWAAAGAVAAAVAVAVLLGSRSWGGGGGPAESPSRAADALASYREALRLAGEARYAAALERAETHPAADTNAGVLFLRGFCEVKLGRFAAGLAHYESALARGAEPAPDGQRTEPWYVWAHVAQALLDQAPDGARDAEVERILREELAGPGLDRSRNRTVLWAQLASQRAFLRNDVPGAERALAANLAENATYRRAALAERGREEDSHYVLQSAFALAAGVHADAARTREVADRILAAKELTAASVAPPQAALFRADGREYVARAELLAARRGEPADLVRARNLLEEALTLRREGNNLEGLSLVEGRLAQLELLCGNPEAALAWSARSVASARAAGDPRTTTDAEVTHLQALAAAGRTREAERLLEEVAPRIAAEPGTPRALALACVRASLPDAGAREEAKVTLRRAAEEASLADTRAVARHALALLAEGRAPVLGPRDCPLAP